MVDERVACPERSLAWRRSPHTSRAGRALSMARSIMRLVDMSVENR